ncbi:coiled-coil domain containing 169 isoform X2 [Stegostoma tigrinum]|uniref:coiled-coil domain containing 169 isoform X2 n=1 Tax=Stegostoma tigrinum TaxID=3053191 RepID=UPI0028701A1E|nr:coiled-coil domain containing 169 isoform X2 [Stegostoma tigrinum]
MYCSDFQNQMSMLQPEQPCLSSQINHQNGCGYSLEGTLQVICEEPHSTSPVRDMLDLSASDLRNTVSQLEKQLDRIEDEGNEWKTRYETQQELNLQLERQIRILEEKKEYIRGNPTDRLSSIRSYEEMPVGLLKQLIKQLEKEKKSLENQLKNFEWRIEQEAKTTLSIEAAKKQKAKWSREKNILKEKYNVPTAERILDLKKGPIKKTVALKQLPKLKH